jgi:hypothetical protein
MKGKAIMKDIKELDRTELVLVEGGEGSTEAACVPVYDEQGQIIGTCTGPFRPY